MKKLFINALLVFVLGMGLFTSCQKEATRDLETSISDTTNLNENFSASSRVACGFDGDVVVDGCCIKFKVLEEGNLIYTVDLGDGNMLSGQSGQNNAHSHCYDKPGNYTLVLTYYDSEDKKCGANYNIAITEDCSPEDCNLSWTIKVDDPCCMLFFVSSPEEWSVDLGFGDVKSGEGSGTFEHCYDAMLPDDFNAVFNCGQTSKLIPLWNPECEKEDCNLSWTIKADDPCCMLFFVSSPGEWSVDLGFGDVKSGEGSGTFEHCYDAVLPDDFNAVFNCGQNSKLVPLWNPECEEEDNCCDIEGELQVIQTGCNSVKVCISGFEDCKKVKYKYFYKEKNGNWIPATNRIKDDCFEFEKLDSCKKYKFKVKIFVKDCDKNPKPVVSKLFKFNSKCSAICGV